MSIVVGCLTLGMLENNTYFLHKKGEYDCIIIDPAKDGELFVTKLREKGLIETEGKRNYMYYKIGKGEEKGEENSE